MTIFHLSKNKEQKMDNDNRANKMTTDTTTPMEMETQEATTTGSIRENFISGLKDQDVALNNCNPEIATASKENTKKVYIKENLNDNMNKLQYEIKKLRVQQKLLLRESDQFKKVLAETSNDMQNSNSDNDQTRPTTDP